MVWVTKSMFFSNLKTFFGKWTFINVLFWKIQNTFEKNDSLHSLRRPPSQSLRGYLYAANAYATGWSRGDHYALVRMIAVILQKMGWKIGNVFFNKLGWPFFRDVFDFIFHRIAFYPSFLIDIYFNITRIPKSGASFEKGPPPKNSIYVPKMGELVFGFFAFRIHPFLGDLL